MNNTKGETDTRWQGKKEMRTLQIYFLPSNWITGRECAYNYCNW